MTVSLAPSLTQLNYQWTNWKVVQSTKNLTLQYNDDGNIYSIWGYDSSEVHLCIIYKGTVPDGIIDSGYSQAQNNSDKTDFENNFKIYANRQIQPLVSTYFILLGSTITANGSTVVQNMNGAACYLIVNIKNAPTGSSPTLQFTVQDIDPVDQATVLGSPTTFTSITGITTQENFFSTNAGSVKVSWTITGASASFTGVDVSTVSKSAAASSPANIGSTGATAPGSAGLMAGIDGSGNTKVPTVSSAGALKVDGSAVTQPVSGTITANAGTGSFTVAQATAANLNATVTGTITANIGTTNGLALDATLTSGTQKAQIYDGSNVIGTTAHPVKVDPTGTTTQPVSGTVTSNIGTTNGLALDATLTGGTQTTKVTDGTNTATVKAASTAAVATDKALVVAISPNNSLTVSNPSVGTIGSTAPTSGTYVGALNSGGVNMSPLNLDASGNLKISGSLGGASDTTASGSLGALNAAVQVTMAGQSGVGMQLAAGTLIGTITPQISYDGGTTWVVAYFRNPITNVTSASITFAASNGALAETIIDPGGASHARVTVTLYTSGTVTCNLRAVTNQDLIQLMAGTDTSGVPQIPQVAKGRLWVSEEEQLLLTENWDSATIDINKWSLAVLTGTITSASGILTMTSGTNATNMAQIKSVSSFAPIGQGSVTFIARAAVTNVTGLAGFLGLGDAASGGSPPPNNCVGFEFANAGGTINCTVGSGGTFTRTSIATTYTDGNYHDFMITYRTNLYVFSIDGVTVATMTPAVSSTDNTPQTSALKAMALLTVTATIVSQTWKIAHFQITESTRTSFSIADATYPTQRSRVSQYGAIAYATMDDLISLGQVPSLASAGASTPFTTTTKGRRIGMAAVTQVLLNDGPTTTYAILTSGSATGTIVSTSASDANFGTGANTITYTWVDLSTGLRHTSTATMNGTTAVAQTWTNSLIAVESMYVASAGSAGAPVGTISIKSSGAATICQLAPGAAYLSSWNGTKFSATGKTTFIRNWRGSMSAVGGTFTLLRGNWLGTVDVGIAGMILDTVFCPAGGNFSVTYNPPLVVTPSTVNGFTSVTNITASVAPASTTACSAWTSFDTVEL